MLMPLNWNRNPSGDLCQSFADDTLRRPSSHCDHFQCVFFYLPRKCRAIYIAEQFGPILKDHGPTKGAKESTCAAVSRLLRSCCPLTVTRFVITVIVDSFETVAFRWPMAHIRKEVLETMFPSIANGNPATSIQVIGLISGEIAARLHALPRYVLRFPLHPVSQPS